VPVYVNANGDGAVYVFPKNICNNLELEFLEPVSGNHISA
jgi:hypothetical protein